MQSNGKKSTFAPKPLSSFTPRPLSAITHYNNNPTTTINNNINAPTDSFVTPPHSTSFHHNIQQPDQHIQYQSINKQANTQYISDDSNAVPPMVEQQSETSDDYTNQYNTVQPSSSSIYDSFDNTDDGLFASFNSYVNEQPIYNDTQNVPSAQQPTSTTPNHENQWIQQNTTLNDQTLNLVKTQSNESAHVHDGELYNDTNSLLHNTIDPLLLSFQLSCMAKQSLVNEQAIHAVNDEAIVICNNNIQSDTFNITISSLNIINNVDMIEFEQMINDIIQQCTANEQVNKHSLVLSHLPTDYLAILYRYQYVYEDKYTGMTMTFESMCNFLNNSIDLTSNLQIHRVTTQQHLIDESTVITGIFRHSSVVDEADSITEWYEHSDAAMLHSPDNANQLYKYVGYIDNVAVCTGMVFIHQSIDNITYAYIADIATVPQSRHHGYATYMMRYLFHIIYQQCHQIYGTTIHLLAEAPGIPLYEKLGFINTGLQYPHFQMAQHNIIQHTHIDTIHNHALLDDVPHVIENNIAALPTNLEQDTNVKQTDVIAYQSPITEPTNLSTSLPATIPVVDTQANTLIHTQPATTAISPTVPSTHGQSIFSYIKQAVHAPTQVLKRNISDALSQSLHYKTISDTRRTQLILKAKQLYRDKLNNKKQSNTTAAVNAADDYNTIQTIETELNNLLQHNRQLQQQLDHKQDEYAELHVTLTQLQIALSENVALHTTHIVDNVSDDTINQLNNDTITAHAQAELYELQYNHSKERNKVLLQRISALYDENTRLSTIADRRQQRIGTISEEQSTLIKTLQLQLNNTIKQSQRREQQLIEERELLTINLKAMVDTLATENDQLRRH